MADILTTILPYLTGGAAGATITIFYGKHKNKIQKMECHYIEDDVISRLPIATEEGDTHQNFFSKKFCLRNTTNSDHKEFTVIFEFDINAKILRHTDSTKGGIDRLKKKLLKPNEYSVTIKNFNRNDEVKFLFEIANISADLVNVTEDDCVGFKIVIKDKRKAKLKSKLAVVNKETLNSSR
jgi:hypothetical protein